MAQRRAENAALGTRVLVGPEEAPGAPGRRTPREPWPSLMTVCLTSGGPREELCPPQVLTQAAEQVPLRTA